ncbi:pre-mRNA-splicing factor CWC26 [Coprinopsis sp. MPI-PUGE-AT-0042]|nr:pre-mRNA-splicing factor CWC26 [Coprinopsis sp. MPI-PUGE-AT-0042]
MSDMKAYLASKYMSGPKADVILAKTAPQKKKKRKKESSNVTGSGGARIVDEDSGWPVEGGQREDDAEDLAEAVVASDRGFKKRKTGQGDASWITVKDGEGGSSSARRDDDEDAVPMDEQSTVVEAPFAGGLLKGERSEEGPSQNAVTKKDDFTEEDIARAQETVYRDAQGKKIDTKVAKAEAARLKREKEEQEARKMEWGKGLTTRTSNEELKEKEIWNDPAAAFMTVSWRKKKSKGPRKPEYNGPPPPPNRFGIRPGYRWDGVAMDLKRNSSKHRNSRKRRTAESYEWGVEDM